MKETKQIPYIPLDFEKFRDLPVGIIPALIIDSQNNSILMCGFMSKQNYEETLDTNRVVFYSRTRRKRWPKGETSGNFLEVKSIISGCENDIILISAKPNGPTCHRMAKSCFDEEPMTTKDLWLL